MLKCNIRQSKVFQLLGTHIAVINKLIYSQYLAFDEWFFDGNEMLVQVNVLCFQEFFQQIYEAKLD